MATFLDRIINLLVYNWKDEKKHIQEEFGIEFEEYMTVEEAIELINEHPATGITNHIFYDMLMLRKELGYANMDI